MRDKFNRELNQLYNEVKEMGENCIYAVETASRAILESPHSEESFTDILKQAKTYEELIDHQERSIDGLCMRLMLHQQPVAGDLRTVTSAHNLIFDMERIGDQACDIAELGEYIHKSDENYKLHINALFTEVISMVKKAVAAFVNNELKLAYNVITDDDKVDSLFIVVKTELINIIKNGGDGELALDMLMVAKYLERIADHSVNIAEWVVYSVTGEYNE